MSRERRSRLDVVMLPRANKAKAATPPSRMSKEMKTKSPPIVKPKKKPNPVEGQVS